MNYSEMSDTEVNIQVCKALGKVISSYCRIRKVGDSSILLDDNETLFNPCNSWADAGPIIAENGIGVVKVVEASCGTGGVIGHWHAVGPVDWAYGECDSDVAHWNQNPLRAAMIVFLMMKDEEAKNESH